jgi:hypothetical protein
MGFARPCDVVILLYTATYLCFVKDLPGTQHSEFSDRPGD